jgi:hypothetical protein
MSLGETEMRDFVDLYYHAVRPHDQELSLKRIRLHHHLLCLISYTAFKLMMESSEILIV